MSTKNKNQVDIFREACYAVRREEQAMQTKVDVRGMTHVALGAVLIAVCSWITVPSAVPFTLQTFAVFAVCALLGGKRGLCAVALYMLLGAAGLPVFSGFGAGVGALLGPTGGYILGFAFTALSMWGVEAKFGEALPARIAGMALGLALCYAFGTAWFMAVYARTNGPIALGAALSMCVFPFILPDIAKMALAILISARLKPLLKRR